MTESISAAAPRPLAWSRESLLADYALGWRSRHASLIGRREVLTGKAKFGIFGDGKELPQLAMARAFRDGDLRSGYYRDQTFMLAIGAVTVEQLFAQLYADADPERDPSSAGRQMNAHFATRMRDERGDWLDLTARPNSAADLSPTAGQMPRLVGLGWASRLYRDLPELAEGFERFSRRGQEIAFGTIGNASTAEGHFWEAVNAIGVLRAPVVLSIWDDGYGISVSNEHQIAMGDLALQLEGFRRAPGSDRGFDICQVAGWDYPALIDAYERAAAGARDRHVPAILHVVELTQPQGHSTSGSHERYKSRERLAWEADHDGLLKMRAWLVGESVATDTELEAIERDALEFVRSAQRAAWTAYQEPLLAERRRFVELARAVAASTARAEEVERVVAATESASPALRRQIQSAACEILVATAGEASPARSELARWAQEHYEENRRRYGSHLHAEGAGSAPSIEEIAPVYADDAPQVNGFEVLNACFDAAFARRPEIVAFGEDVGYLGDVNQGMHGLQAKYGELRVADTGIREATIMGQAIGLALRGIRPIAEIQYLDYVLYGIQTLSDDLASLRYRTHGAQAAPVIVRTRGHRLEGIWHAGSQMGALLSLLRGLWLCVPRDMTRAAGMYNTLLAGDDPAIVVEVLNGYRAKELMPSNVGDFRVPLGRPEVLRPGRDATLVTYGACCRIAMEAAELLAALGVEVEVIDVQTLLPFDVENRILASLARTHRLAVLDEDVPGGASAFILQQLVERQGGFWWLDAPPVTITGREHRPAYGSDGDYFSKPSRDEVVRALFRLVREDAADALPGLF
ncbi:MAG: transketolase [Acidobacteria bacterium]|nr:transketolase [Acidobacteriota bacterium]MCB9378173.1 transketolase [Holophagales bacterium]